MRRVKHFAIDVCFGGLPWVATPTVRGSRLGTQRETGDCSKCALCPFSQTENSTPLDWSGVVRGILVPVADTRVELRSVDN